jgi:hypothetical protein
MALHGSVVSSVNSPKIDTPEQKMRNAVAVRKGIPHNHVDIQPLVSVEETEVCLPIGNSEVLLPSV